MDLKTALVPLWPICPIDKRPFTVYNGLVSKNGPAGRAGSETHKGDTMDVDSYKDLLLVQHRHPEAIYRIYAMAQAAAAKGRLDPRRVQRALELVQGPRMELVGRWQKHHSPFGRSSMSHTTPPPL